MDKEKIIEKVTKKREYSQLPKEDVEHVFDKFKNLEISDEEKIKSMRKFLMENYSGFGSRKILKKSIDEKGENWFLKKHLSTRERFPHYGRIYERILKGFENEKFSIIDLGCGVNGFSYKFFLDLGIEPEYLGIEAMGQFVEKTNKYFQKEDLNGKVFHESLMNMKKIKKIVQNTKRPRIAFMFKVIDSLESMERNYSKKLILDLKKDIERFAVSFPTKSMVSRESIWAKRTWFSDFVDKEFNLIDSFEEGDEKYFIFENNTKK